MDGPCRLVLPLPLVALHPAVEGICYRNCEYHQGSADLILTAAVRKMVGALLYAWAKANAVAKPKKRGMSEPPSHWLGEHADRGVGCAARL